MESRDYEKILNAMPETGVYVVREEDRAILYFNQRVREVSPDVRLGTPCYAVWAGTCGCCPLLTIEGRQESRSVSYNDPYGGVVDITATRTLWEGRTPAFVITVAPRMDSGGYTYRKILYVDLERDVCDVLKSDAESWQPEHGAMSVQMERFAQSGAIHPEDAERFIDFIQPQHLRLALRRKKPRNLLYRRQMGADYRWNLIEVIPDQDEEERFAILCIKDVHDVLREGLEREGLTLRGQEIIRSLGERNSNIYTIDLNTGDADPIRVDGRMVEGADFHPAPWEELMERHIADHLHTGYLEEFRRRFSVTGLRRAKAEGRQKEELLCQWHSGEDYRYISITAYFSRELKEKSYTVLAIQDVDERTRGELAQARRDMQMAAVLQSRFKMMNTVHLDSGLCERMDLTKPAGFDNVRTGDYTTYIQRAASSYVHPDDAEQFQAVLGLDHLREKAEATEDYAEEVCIYRQQGDPVRWIELRVIYSRREDQVMVNILGQDVTREKSREESSRQALEDRAYIISSLSSLFFSTYYVDLDQDTFRTVTQLSRIGDVLGNEVNCTAALRVYANHFIHPDDREEYLRIMSVGYLREKLRWWQPCVAVEYRKMSDEPGAAPDSWSWVRATAILARTGTDDMPKTAVYVAQDIGDGRRA